MPINSDGTLRIPRPEPVAYDDTEMEPDGLRVVATSGFTDLDETAERSMQITAIMGVNDEDITERLERIYGE